jgi:hypothetical protein
MASKPGSDPAEGAAASRAVARKGGTSENIQVFIRIRPLVDREKALQDQANPAFTPCIRAIDDQVRYRCMNA